MVGGSGRGAPHRHALPAERMKHERQLDLFRQAIATGSIAPSR
jgi:hypothetical protein